MSKNKSGKKRGGDVVYSTNPDYNYDYNNDHEDTLDPEDQNLEVHIDKKGRKGKIATIIKGFVGAEDDLAALGKVLKTKCGVGGSAKDGEIIIQGNVREKVMKLLEEMNYSVKRVGG